MKKIILLFLLLTNYQSYCQSEKNICRVNKSAGKLVFWNAEPIQEYEIAFSFENIIPNMNCLGPSQVTSATVQNANYEAGLQSRLYDAIIFTAGVPRSIAIIFKDKTKDISLGRTKRITGKLVFIESEPIAEYDMINQYDVNMNGRVAWTGHCATHGERIDKLLRLSFKDEKKHQFDGVIFTTQKKDFSIKFKQE